MESAGEPGLTTAWKTIYARFGLELKIESVGCCGMAGIYGHEAEHAATSHAIFDQQWRPILERLPSEIPILATGFSCRHQAARHSQVQPRHPVSFLVEALIG